MAYYEQKIISARPGPTTGTDHENPQIQIVNGTLDDSYINKAVSYDGEPTNLASPEVKLSGDGDIVIGSIIGLSYGKLQIAVDGWDIKFLVGSTVGAWGGNRIIGAVSDDVPGVTDGTPGYVVNTVLGVSYSAGNLINIFNGRGDVFKGSGTPGQIVYVSMKLGG